MKFPSKLKIVIEYDVVIFVKRISVSLKHIRVPKCKNRLPSRFGWLICPHWWITIGVCRYLVFGKGLKVIAYIPG